MKLAAAVLFVLAGVAEAGPTARVGITYGLLDQGGPDEVKVGPMVAFGQRLGILVGELEWSYLSFFDPNASTGGVHRLGVTLRADLYRTQFMRTCPGEPASDYTCAHGNAIYAEAGAAERFGRWTVDATRVTPATTPQPEAHIGLGFEMDNRLGYRRDGWQLGVRFALAPADQLVATSCRSSGGAGCSGAMLESGGGLEKSLYVEWMFLFGR
jgi:hypothetical protein